MGQRKQARRPRSPDNDYEGAWQEWAETDDAALWEATADDGTPG